jgi:hypothetical protein
LFPAKALWRTAAAMATFFSDALNIEKSTVLDYGAFDLRDSQGRDPAFYAARALESTIKIISDDKQLTTGREKGAANYITI